MKKRIINPNDLFIVEFDEIKQMAEKNNKPDIVKMLEDTGASFLKIFFKENELGFISAVHELLDRNNQVIKDRSFDFHPDDYLSFIEKFNNVQYIAGTPNNGGKLRNRRSVVSMDYDVFHDGDVFHMPYSEFIKEIGKIAAPEYLKDYQVMGEHGVEHIFFSFHYVDDRKNSGNKLYGFYDDLRNVEINPYYKMVFNIWATDANGTYLYEDGSDLPDDEDRNFKIIQNINEMRKDLLYNLEDPNMELNHSRLGSDNFEKFFNNYDFVRTMNQVGNLSDPDVSFIKTKDMISLVKKQLGFEFTVKKGDYLYIPTSSLSEKIKKKYALSEEVNTLKFYIESVDNVSRYLSIKMSVANKDGEKYQDRELLVREFDEILADSNNKQIFYGRDDNSVAYKRGSLVVKDDYFAPMLSNLQYEKTYSFDITLLKKLKNKELNNKLDKLLALGNRQILFVLKIDHPYKINGRVDPITHRTNGKIGFETAQFPELAIYAFDNTTGKGILPKALEDVSISSILENIEKAKSYIHEKSKDDVIPVSDNSFKSAAFHSLGLGDIIKLLKLQKDLNMVKHPLGNFKTRTEFNLYTISQIGKNIVLELNEKELQAKEGKKNNSPKMRP